jgi:hypothetical protein
LNRGKTIAKNAGLFLALIKQGGDGEDGDCDDGKYQDRDQEGHPLDLHP